jgi:CubicO group peptidase (beta-lactamase class C family)
MVTCIAYIWFIMKKLVISIMALFILTAIHAQTKITKEVAAQIQQVENGLVGRLKIDGRQFNIKERMAHYKVKGVSIAVVQNYKVVWAKGYGWADEKEKRPVTTSTLFEPGSISKSLNAVGVLKLAQDQQLDLDADINNYLQKWKFPYDSVSKGKKISLKHLLSHTAGLSVHGFPGYDRKVKIPSLPEILDGKTPANTAAVRSLFEPGLRYQYSGGGTTISQLIIEEVSKQPYHVFIYDNVLKPMGMLQSSYQQPPAPGKMKHVATGYRADGSEVENKFHVYPEQGAAGLWTTPTELGNYIIETQLALQGKSSKVLNQSMTQLRLTPFIDQSSALGVFIENREGSKYFSHSAGNEGFRGFYLGSMEGGNGLAVFVNSDNGGILSEIINSITAAYDWKGFAKPADVKTVQIPGALMKKYVGVYYFDGVISEVILKDDGLYFWTDFREGKMYFTNEKDFVNIEFSAEKSFLEDSAGNVSGYARRVNGREYPPARKVFNVDTLQIPAAQLNAFGWHLMETKRIDEAIKYLNRGITLSPDDVNLKINLAHCYLFNNENARAIALYKTLIERDRKDEVSKIIKDDFEYMVKNGFDKTLIENVKKALNIN